MNIREASALIAAAVEAGRIDHATACRAQDAIRGRGYGMRLSAPKKPEVIEIRNRYSDAVLFSWEADSDVTGLTVGEKLGLAVRKAVEARANLADANLADANLAGAYLAGANLAGAKNVELAIARTRILPEGDLIGWKKCKNGVIVKLRIPTDAKRSHAFGRKCRAEFADVLDVIGADVGISRYDSRTRYVAGERITPDAFDDNWQDECSHGVHFYITREEAEAHV